jgi:plasmid replication initiation protein
MVPFKQNTREHKLILRALSHTSEIEKKACMAIAYKINKLTPSDWEGKGLYPIEIPMEDLIDQLNTNYNSIKNMCRKIVKKTIEMKIPYTLKNGKTKVFDSVQVVFPSASIEKNTFRIEVKETVLPLFSRALTIYRHYNIIEAKFLTHKHSIEMYKFLKDKLNQDISDFTISLKMLKFELGLDSKYKMYHQLKQRVIDPAQIDMEKNGVIGFKYKEIKRSRAVTDLIFFIQKNKEKEQDIYFKERLKTYTKQTLQEQFIKDFKQFLKESFCLSPVSKTLKNAEFQNQLKLLEKRKSLTIYPKEIQERFIKYIDHPELF